MKINPKRSSAASLQEKRVLLAQLLRRPSDVPAVAPLSYGQKALYFLHRSDPESPAYHVAFTARFRSPVDTVLRDGEPVQEIISRCPVDFEQVDASSWSEERLDEAMREAYRRPFDLERGPVFRSHLFTLAEDHHAFLITIHHIVYDAWSLWVNQDELAVFYAGETMGTRTLLPVWTEPTGTLSTSRMRCSRGRREVGCGPIGKSACRVSCQP